MKRDTNLFDAFQSAAPKPPAPEQEVQPTAVLQSMPVASAPTRLVAIFAASVLLAFVVGYFVGGAGGEDPDQVLAGEPGTANGAPSQPLGGDAERPWYQTAGERAGDQGSAPNGPESAVSGPSGLYNAANLYTVLAITYKDVPSNQDQAKKISDYLKGKGLPAFEPISRSGNIEILVGAADTQGALQAVATQLRNTPGPNGRTFDFQSAYIVPIDNHLDRD